MAKGPLPQPSRLMLNTGILVGGLVGFIIQSQAGADDLQAFIITGVAALLGAFLFSIIDITLRKKS